MGQYIILIYLSLTGCATTQDFSSPKHANLRGDLDLAIKTRCANDPNTPTMMGSQERCEGLWRYTCSIDPGPCEQALPQQGMYTWDIGCASSSGTQQEFDKCIERHYPDRAEKLAKIRAAQRTQTIVLPAYDQPGMSSYDQSRLDELEHQQRQMQCQQANVGNRVNAVCP